MNERVAIVSGTRKGLGKEITEHFLSRGYFVHGCSRKESSIDHKNYFHSRVDVADEPAIAAFVNTVYKKHRKIDILINNAGTALMNHTLLTPGSAVEKIFKTNFFGTFFFCREVAKKMLQQKAGRIVNISSIAVTLSLAGESVYASSKSAIETFTRILAVEMGTSGITVNAIAPSAIKTDLIKNVSDEKINALLKRQSIPRIGTPQDVIHAIDFFIAPESDFITGQTLYLGGPF